MALTVRPDDEVYQFDTVWLGPDEYTLPIQARYVAWGTWLACFLIAAAVLVPLGGSGPGGVVGSLTWSLALSVVASRAVMLVVDHERPLRSLPQLFSAEARAALASTRQAERALIVRPTRVRVRELPERARRIRDRHRRVEVRRMEQRLKRRRVPAASRPAVRIGAARVERAELPEAAPAFAQQAWVPSGRSGPVWSSGGYVDWDEADGVDQTWAPTPPAQRAPAAFEYVQHDPDGHYGPGEGYPQAGRPGAATPVAYSAHATQHVDQSDVEHTAVDGDQVDPLPAQQYDAQHPAEGRRPIEERILLPVRKYP